MLTPYKVTGDCIEWQHARSRGGYGETWANGKREYVHRLEWRKHYGDIPVGMCVLHKCDNPSCYNITHLFLGTKADNMLDKVSKGRGKNPNQRLTTDQVASIRRRLLQGVPNRVLGDEYGVTASNISHIKHGRRWR